MKKFYYLFLFITIVSLSYAQRQSITWQGLQREYIIRIPSSWDGQRQLPVVYILHGVGGEVETYDSTLNITSFSDMSGWITVLPQALNCNMSVMGQQLNLGTLWNAGLSANIFNQTFSPNSNIDDEGFLLALLDSMETIYPIDRDSIFMVGSSMGGFMTNYMGIKHSDIFAGISPICGTIPNNSVNTQPTNHLNVLYFHGTNDQVVNYADGSTNNIPHVGTVSLGLGAEQTVDYWKEANNCNIEAIIDSLEDRREDGLRFVNFQYKNVDDGTKVNFIKILNGEHAWYVNSDIHDIDFLVEIYKFFSGNNIQYPNSGIKDIENTDFAIYPNPAINHVNISVRKDCSIQITNSLGQKIKNIHINYGNTILDISYLKPGFYFLSLQDKNQRIVKKLIVK